MLETERPGAVRRRKSFRAAGARIFQQEAETQPGVISLLAARTPTAVREIPLDRIVPNPNQPRLTWVEETLQELAASIREHGVLQPILVRPVGESQYEIMAGERRWRASKLAGRDTVPAIVERFDDSAALEIALIENLQREDLSPLDEAVIYKKMTDELGYSIRSLAQKLGKDKGYLENRLRLATAPDDIKQMVALRRDTLAAAYELLQLDDKHKRRALVKRVVDGKLTLLKLRERVDTLLGKIPPKHAAPATLPPLKDDALVKATRKLSEAIADLARILASDGQLRIEETDRENLAKFLHISRTRMDNLVARLRSRGGR